MSQLETIEDTRPIELGSHNVRYRMSNSQTELSKWETLCTISDTGTEQTWEPATRMSCQLCGRCTTFDILELMNERGKRRMQHQWRGVYTKM